MSWCKWIKWRDGMWRCTNPESEMLGNDTCNGRGVSDEVALDYCPDYEYNPEAAGE